MDDRLKLTTTLTGLEDCLVLGRPSRWFSIPGTVVAHVESDFPVGLVCSINGVSPMELALGPDSGRLVGKGDFVADIPWEMVHQGMNQLLFVMQLPDGSICSSIQDFNLVLEPYQSSSHCYDFTKGTLPGDIGALIVDGLWVKGNGGIKPVAPGYDRLVAFGDAGLRDFSVRAEMTIHGFSTDAPGYPEAMGPGAGFLLRWTGHHPDEYSPNREWRPIGVLAWYRYGRDLADTVRDYRLQLLGGRLKADHTSEPLAEDCSGRKLELGVSHTYFIEASTIAGQKTMYRLKVWKTGTPEPDSWDLEGTSLPGEATTGSVLFVLHYAHATLHRLSIR